MKKNLMKFAELLPPMVMACVCAVHGVIATRAARSQNTSLLDSKFTHHNTEMSHAICAVRASNMTQAHFSRSLLSFSRTNLISKYSTRTRHGTATHTCNHSFTFLLFLHVSELSRERLRWSRQKTQQLEFLRLYCIISHTNERHAMATEFRCLVTLM